MLLSTAQVQRFWREWYTTCAAMHWTRDAGMTAAQIEAKRKEFLAACGFNSLTQVDRTAGFTKVLHELIVLRGTSLRSAHETIDPGLNAARVIRHQLAGEIIPCLEHYVGDVRAYVAQACRYQTNAMRNLDLPACTCQELTRLRYTLAARLNSLRRAAGDTIHDMRTKSQVPCDCAACKRAEFVRQEVTADDGVRSI